MSKNKRPSQAEQILNYLIEHPSGITSKEAIDLFGCMRLASRISELRDEFYNIETRMIKVKNRYGETVSVAKYVLKGEKE